MNVFVYGSLLRGLGNHHHLDGAKYLGRGRTRPVYQMHSLGAFPGVVRGGKQAIVGELYDVDYATLARLDRLEGHPRFYERSSITLEDGTETFVYLLPRDAVARRPVVSSGDWSQHRKGQRS